MRRFRKNVLGAVLLVLAIAASACGSGGDDGEDGDTGGQEKGPITVGVSGAFPENQIVAQMYALVLEDAGYDVSTQLDIETREISDPALESGEIDVKPEYLASELLFLDPDAEAGSDPQELVSQLEPLLEENGVAILEPSPAQDQNAFVVTSEFADSEGVSTVSDLQPLAGDLTLGGPPECPRRPFCILGLKDVYDIEFGNFQPIADTAARVTALTGESIDVALLFSTDPQIVQENLVVLEDDQGLQAAENITPVVRQEVLNDEITELLNSVSAALDTETMTELNGRVAIDQEDPETVAQEFLEQEGLL
ncbi:MAG: ABC transporter substrate-binding protein [Actinomycetota bacterium]|nr:ABC transporter substrate-binding protein [Actinomycetota bacterium]